MTAAIGAEILGVRLSVDLPATTVTVIRDALLRHRVVFSVGVDGQHGKRRNTNAQVAAAA